VVVKLLFKVVNYQVILNYLNVVEDHFAYLLISIRLLMQPVQFAY